MKIEDNQSQTLAVATAENLAAAETAVGQAGQPPEQVWVAMSSLLRGYGYAYLSSDGGDDLVRYTRADVLEFEARQWQPIETAPKNRKLIVGYFNPLGNWRSVMGCYFTEGVLESDTDESGFAPEGWYEDTEAYEYLMPMDQEPTLWTQLPDPPTQKAGEVK